MKLHTLEISAFGPFAGKEVINFADLGDNPLFLIDGQTGAGKSSILHAICYALYGETTDSERKEQGLRSDHATPDILTELVLTFSIRGQKFRIARVPTQIRPAKRGDGEAEHKASAHLVKILDDGTEETLVPKKKTAADAHIKDIVGLSADQFRQVMVLPQGKFRELLLAKSDDRQVILSTLFQTEIYKRIESILKDKAGDIERQNKIFETSKQEAINEANAELENQTQHKERAEKRKQHDAAALKSADNLMNAFVERDKKHENLKALHDNKDAIDTKRIAIKQSEKSARIAPVWQILQATNTDVIQKTQDIVAAKETATDISEKLNHANTALNNATNANLQRDSLKTKENLLIGYRHTLSNYESLKSEATRTANEHQKVASKKADTTEQLNVVNTEIKAHDQKLQQLSEKITLKARIVEQEIHAKNTLETRRQLDTANNKLAALKDAVSQAQTNFEQENKTYQITEREADRLDLLWLNSQAAVLAEKLQDNDPCQVCGSKEHPQLATFNSEAENINQGLVDQARSKQEQQLQVRSEADKQLSAQQATLEQQQETLKTLATSLGESAQQSVATLQAIQNELCDRLKQIEADEIALKNTSDAKKKCDAERIKLQAEFDNLSTLLPELIKAETTASNNLQSAEKELPEEFRSLDTLEKAITSSQNTINQLENKLKNTQETEREIRSSHDTATATITSLEKALIELNSRQVKQQETWEQALSESDFKTQTDFKNAQIEQSEFETLKKDVLSFDEYLRDLAAQIGLMDEQLNGQQKPDVIALQKSYEDTENVFKAAEEEWTIAQTNKAMLTKTLNKIESINNKQKNIRLQYEVVGKLHKAASGKGEVKVSLERFVLGNLLDSVLSIASQRLHIMSKGQYRLVRQDETHQRRNAPTGLDLAIDDAHSGKTRPVATLSGGESFMASLSLALALSDVVQQRSGGIQMDTLFVDEGFGSLDPESLQLAIDTLVDLQSTGRTIGIISHVAELKEQMPQRIDVVCTRNGSTVKIKAA